MLKTVFKCTFSSVVAIALAFSVPTRKAQAVDPVLAALSVVGGCAAILLVVRDFRKVRADAARYERAYPLADLLMAKRGSTSESLRSVLRDYLVVHPEDIALLGALFQSLEHDDVQLENRLRFHVSVLQKKRRDLADWLVFNELKETREVWQRLQAKGWTVDYDDWGNQIPGVDSLFKVSYETRKITFRTAAYLNSGPVAAAWAVYSADASERVFGEHRKAVEAWTTALGPEAGNWLELRQFSLTYFHKLQTWQSLLPVYRRFAKAHPEQTATFWEGHEAHLTGGNPHALSAMVLQAFFVNPEHGLYKAYLETDLETILERAGG